MIVFKKQLAKEIHECTGYTVDEAKMFLDALQKVVYRHLKNGNDVKLFQGLTLKIQRKKSYKTYSGALKKDVIVPEHAIIKAVVSPYLREYVRHFGEKNDYKENVLYEHDM